MKYFNLYNSSDIGYMDEEWVNYDPKKFEVQQSIEVENKKVENEEQTEHEEQTEKV